MKKKLFKRRFLVLAFATMLVFACSDDSLDGVTDNNGERGEQGIQGPEGPEGPQGPAGADGADGADGLNGGADGVDGIDGADGADGADGMDGEDGAPGPAGADGVDGMDGADGADGQDGLNGGVNGTDGQDGTDGAPGADGEDGQDGADGNANVVQFLYEAIGEGGSSSTQIDLPASITEAVIDNSLVVVYLKFANGVVQQVPGEAGSLNVDVSIFDISNTVRIELIYRRQSDDSPFVLPTGLFEHARILIIPASSSTLIGGKTSPQQAVRNELAAAGIDTADYEAVAAYYGLSSK